MDPKEFYDSWAVDVPEAPPFTDDVLPYINQLERRADDEAWTEFRARIDYEREQADKGTNLLAAIYANDDAEKGRRFVVDGTEEDGVDTILSKAGANWPAVDPLAFEIFAALVRLSPIWSYLPSVSDEKSADFVWARMRCLIAGAGFVHHAALAAILCDLYAGCPLVPTETAEEWDKLLLEAHKNCGWPVQIGLVPWKDWCDVIRTGDGPQQEWHRAVAMLHVLKHVRRTDGTLDLVVTYRGVAAVIELDKRSTVIGHMKTIKANLLSTLATPTSGEDGHPLASALNWAMGKLTADRLLQRRSLSNLPGLVLAGPWSTLTPDPAGNDGFVQHGLRLTGVWQAGGGRIQDTTGDDDDILSYAWNISTANNSDAAKSRRELARILPSTYAVAFPSDVLLPAFPNLELGHFTEILAAKCLFDAPIVATLIRDDIPELAKEFPLVAFLPSIPSLDLSTNQGKSYAAHSYSRVMAPAIPLYKAPESLSAPDVREIANKIRDHGTLCLDEWKMPTFNTHLLSRDNLQSMCSGGTLGAGRAYENSGDVKLTHPIVCSSKALAYPPDLVNRSMFWYLGNLTDEQRDDVKTFEKIQSGELSLTSRLGVLALIENHDIINKLHARPKASSNALRWGAHRALAELLYELRGGTTPGAIDNAMREMKARFEQHCQDAEDNDVFSMLEEGRSLRLRITSFFADMPECDIQDLANYCNMKGFKHGNSPIPVASMTTLIQGRMETLGFHGRPFSDLLPILYGSRMRTSNRQIVRGLGEDIRRTIPASGLSWPLPGALGMAGWVLYRVDNNGSISVQIRKHAPAVVGVPAPSQPIDALSPSPTLG